MASVTDEMSEMLCDGPYLYDLFKIVVLYHHCLQCRRKKAGENVETDEATIDACPISEQCIHMNSIMEHQLNCTSCSYPCEDCSRLTTIHVLSQYLYFVASNKTQPETVSVDDLRSYFTFYVPHGSL